MIVGARKGDAGAGDFNSLDNFLPAISPSGLLRLVFFQNYFAIFPCGELSCPLRLWRSVSAFSSELSGSGFGCGSSCFFGASSSNSLTKLGDHSANIFHNPLAKSANIFYKRFLLLNIGSTTEALLEVPL